MDMNVGSATGIDAALNAVTNVDQKRAALQVALLRKALDSQEQQAAEILKMVEGKGQQLDIRV
ncbi:MAG TPA: putative motility protein [Fimbriimonadaceae bacterium]|nr:putative motility protein [Fimbriimonadaceae bacterium]